MHALDIAYFSTRLFSLIDLSPLWRASAWGMPQGLVYVTGNILMGVACILMPLIYFVSIRPRRSGQIPGKRLRRPFIIFIGLVALFTVLDALDLWIPLHQPSAVIRVVAGIVSWIVIFRIPNSRSWMVAVQMPLPGSPISNDSYEIQDPEARAHAAKEQATELARAQQYRMMAEEDTRELIFRLNEAEQSARIGSIQWDMATDRITLSEMAYHIIGMIPGSPVNRHKLAEQVHPADLRFVEDSIEKNLRDKVFKDFYFRMLTAQMETRFVLVKARIVRNDLGNAIMLKGTLQDVSELRAYMLRIDQQNRKLKRIAWLQSHRMRSPVATIMGMADLLNLQRHEDPVNVEVVRNIKDLTHKLDAMIHEVDSLTKQEEMV